MSETLIEFPKVPATFQKRRFDPRETGVALRGTQSVPNVGSFAGALTATAAAIIEIDKLYPEEAGVSSDILTVLTLLSEAGQILEEARTASRRKDLVTSDRYVQRFQALLPRLFASRGVGDGYAVVINSLHFAFVALRGKPVSFEQLTTIWRVLRELRNRPFIPFEQALDSATELENAGLQIDPPIIGQLVGDTDDE